jgi:hypothetical protein
VDGADRHRDDLLAGGLLMLAGADLLARWVEVGRERVTTPERSIQRSEPTSTTCRPWHSPAIPRVHPDSRSGRVASVQRCDFFSNACPP